MTVYSSMGDPPTLDTYAAVGINRVVVWLPPQDHATVMAALDQHAETLADWLAPA